MRKNAKQSPNLKPCACNVLPHNIQEHIFFFFGDGELCRQAHSTMPTFCIFEPLVEANA